MTQRVIRNAEAAKADAEFEKAWAVVRDDLVALAALARALLAVTGVPPPPRRTRR